MSIFNLPNTTGNAEMPVNLTMIHTILYGYIGIVILILGSCGNICNLLLFTSLSSFTRLASCRFLVTSAIGSQLVLSTNVLSEILNSFFNIESPLISLIWCKSHKVLGSFGGGIALTCLSLASIDQYFVTCRQVNRHRWITIKRSFYIILIVVFIWLLLVIPDGFFYSSSSCIRMNSIYVFFSVIFTLISYSLIPSIILIVFSALTWYNLNGNQTRLVRPARIQHQVSGMMLAQICFVLSTSVPDAFAQVYAVATRTVIKSTLEQTQETILLAILTTLGFITHAGTFYVYLFASNSYRTRVKTFISRWQQRLNRIVPRITQ